ncbi:MAG: PAS domain-containing protein, partial [Candidatus Micrarchaeota archaeon]|nr:PAS domain-containing protein [Candidatus Micrarchaeota archaeon]
MAADDSAMTRLMLDIFDLEGRRSDSDELLRGFGDRLRVTFGLDSVEAKVVEKGAISPAEEFAINTMKPFVDNRLSSYSQFKELVDSFNLGYKSCAIVPIASNGKALAVMKILSKREERFDGDILGALSVSTMVVGSQMASKMEQEKSVSVAKYFDAAFNSVVPQALIDSAGAIVKANKSMLILFSASTKEMAGRNIRELFEIDANMLAALRGGRTAETKIANRGDRRFKVSSGAVNEKIMHIAFYETTELRDLEERMKMLKYSGYEALLMMDPKTKILWVSDNVEKVAKFNRDSIIGKKLLDLVIDRGKLAATIGALGNSVVTDSARVSIGNGNYQDMRISLFKNDLYGLSCILVNNAVENAYKTIERNFDELVKLSGDAILFVDQLGYIQRMNKSAENILGYREQEIVGSPANMIYSTQQEQDRFLRWLADTRQQGAINNVFAMLKTRKPDTAIPCEISIRSFYDQDGNLSGYVVVARELQTKRALEVAEDQLDEKERMIDKLGEESELKSQFIFNISHDIKTPITNIKGFASILKNGEHGQLNSEQKEYIGIIMNES